MGANIDLGLIHQRFFFVRHGQTDWNRSHRAMGQTDVPLNPTGEQEARAAAQRLQTCDIRMIFHSPLARARTTAEIIADQLKLPLHPLTDLRQCNWGSMEGQPRGDESWRLAWRRGELAIDGAETFREFAHRVCSAVNQALSHGQPVLIVAHGATYAAIQRAINQADRDMQNGLPLHYRPPGDGCADWVHEALAAARVSGTFAPAP